ncbi:uncharacterized protein C8Q71DRAFT_558650 [Rhodofomes roseus]|uniref:Uncharacterized protein n=1 Tax=Rhodofomes roseus TaxID=34475 RepID=A0ABQ8KIF1_9APHY|nr:uncharacterized protein C8Q71DRAFT_558650 [Rhodofomes roseus]KAH9837738.1 hypothetical protein C8Q71DRAFT_558650 [Rhodofomes roseus]
MQLERGGCDCARVPIDRGSRALRAGASWRGCSWHREVQLGLGNASYRRARRPRLKHLSTVHPIAAALLMPGCEGHFLGTEDVILACFGYTVEFAAAALGVFCYAQGRRYRPAATADDCVPRRTMWYAGGGPRGKSTGCCPVARQPDLPTR